MSKNKISTKSIPIAFRVSEDEFNKIAELISQIKTKNVGNLIKDVRIDKSKFYRLFFFEGVDVVEKKLNKSNLCSKCGKPLAISVPRHLRSRIDVCECDKK